MKYASSLLMKAPAGCISVYQPRSKPPRSLRRSSPSVRSRTHAYKKQQHLRPRTLSFHHGAAAAPSSHAALNDAIKVAQIMCASPAQFRYQTNFSLQLRPKMISSSVCHLEVICLFVEVNFLKIVWCFFEKLSDFYLVVSQSCILQQ